MSTSEWFLFWDARAQKALGRYLSIRETHQDAAKRYELTAVRGLLRGAVHARGKAKRHLRFLRAETV